MIYLGDFGNLGDDRTHAERLAVAPRRTLTDSEKAKIAAEIEARGLKGQTAAVVVVELVKSSMTPGLMPRVWLDSGAFASLRSKVAAAAKKSSATAQQKAVWEAFSDPSASMSDMDAVDLTVFATREALDACLAVGLINQDLYNAVMFEDSGRTMGWCDANIAHNWALEPSDLEGLL